MSKKKRNVFNLPEALYRGILEDVRNDPNLYINPDPTVHEDIHYMAYTLYAQRPSDSELSRNYINALIKVGEVCDEIERRIGKPIDRKIMDAAKAQVEKDKKARHAKEAEEHKNDKDFFGNPKPYVHKYWKYEEETEDTLALIEVLKAYYSGKMTSSDEDDEEEVVELTKRNKHGKNKKKKYSEPIIVEIDEDDDDEDEEDSDEDDDFDDEEDDDDTPEITIGGFSYDRNRNYRAELAEALDDDDDDEDDEDEDDSDEDEEEDDEDDDTPVLRTPSFMKPSITRPAPTPKEEPSDPFAGFECEADDEDADLDSVDLESEQAAFDAWVAKQNTDEAVVDMGSLAASSDSHRLADSDDELSDDDDDEEEDGEEEIPDDPYAKVRHLIPAGMEPDDYHRKVLRTILQATSCWPDKPEKVDIMPLDELFQYYSLKNPEATIKQFKKLPAYAPYLDKYLPGWNEKADEEAPKKDNAPVVKESTPVKKPAEKVKAEIVEETPVAKPDPSKPMTFAEFDAYAKSMVEQAKADAAQQASDYYKFRAEHPWPVKKSSKVEAEIVEEKPEETKPDELEKDEITFAGDRLTPEEADAIMDASFGGNEPDEDEDSEESDDNGAESVPYYQIDAFADFESNCDNIVRISDDVNVVSINLDYLDDSDPDVVNRDNPAVNMVVGQYYASMYEWIQQTLIHYRPSVILTPDEYNSMMSGVEGYDQFQYVFFKLGTKYVACYSMTDRFYDTIKDLLHYLSANNQLTSFFKKYTKIVSDIDGFSFVNTNRQYSWMMDNIVNSEMNDSEMKNAFISDFKNDAILSDPDDEIEPITFNVLDASAITGGDEDKEFYDSILKIIYGITHEIEPADDDDDDEEDTPVAEAETVSEVPSTPSEERNPNQEMVNAANTLFTLTADKKVDLDDVGMVARKLQDFVNKEVAEARGKLNPEELAEDDSDDEVEDDDDIEEEYFPNRRKEVKKASSPVKKPVQKPQKNNSDDDPNAFVIQRR